MPFESFQGWENKPTWSTALHLSCFPPSGDAVRELLHGESPECSVVRWFEGAVANWYRGMHDEHAEAISAIIGDLISTSAFQAHWDAIRIALETGKELEDGNSEIDQATLTFFRSVGWHDILGKKAKSGLDLEIDERLRAGLLDFLEDWKDHPAVRLQRGPLQLYMARMQEHWFKAIKWADVLAYFQGEEEGR